MDRVKEDMKVAGVTPGGDVEDRGRWRELIHCSGPQKFGKSRKEEEHCFCSKYCI